MPGEKQTKVLAFRQGADFYFSRYERLLAREDYVDALSALRTAHEKAPDNLEYTMELAELYTEMDFYEESNCLLLGIFSKEPGYQEECLYGMGCNFFGLQDPAKARECFAKILEYYPDGSYAADAGDFLDYLDEEAEDDDLPPEVMERADRGRYLIDHGQAGEAADIFEDLAEKYPEELFLKNNLALACYCEGQTDRAMELSRQVLQKDRYSPHALCNLVLFALGTGRRAEVEEYRPMLAKADCREADDDIKVALTYCELGEEEAAYPLFGRALEELPYDYSVLYFRAACANNLHKPREAMDTLRTIQKLWPHDTVAPYYLREIARAEQVGESLHMLYNCQVPDAEIEQRLQYLNAKFALPAEELRQCWREDARFEDLLRWSAQAGGDDAKQTVVRVLRRIADAKAEEMLRRWLLRRDESDDVKNWVLYGLHEMGAEQPYLAYLSGKVTEVRMGRSTVAPDKVPDAYDQILRELLDLLEKWEKKTLLPRAVELFAAYLQTHTRPPMLRNTGAWAGALAAIAMQEQTGSDAVAEAADRLQVAPGAIRRRVALIHKRLIGGKDHAE